MLTGTLSSVVSATASEKHSVHLTVNKSFQPLLEKNAMRVTLDEAETKGPGFTFNLSCFRSIGDSVVHVSAHSAPCRGLQP